MLCDLVGIIYPKVQLLCPVALIWSVALWVEHTHRYSYYAVELICFVVLWVEYTQRYSRYAVELICSVVLWVEYTHMYS